MALSHIYVVVSVVLVCALKRPHFLYFHCLLSVLHVVLAVFYVRYVWV